MKHINCIFTIVLLTSSIPSCGDSEDSSQGSSEETSETSSSSTEESTESSSSETSGGFEPADEGFGFGGDDSPSPCEELLFCMAQCDSDVDGQTCASLCGEELDVDLATCGVVF